MVPVKKGRRKKGTWTRRPEAYEKKGRKKKEKGIPPRPEKLASFHTAQKGARREKKKKKKIGHASSLTKKNQSAWVLCAGKEGGEGLSPRRQMKRRSRKKKGKRFRQGGE